MAGAACIAPVRPLPIDEQPWREGPARTPIRRDGSRFGNQRELLRSSSAPQRRRVDPRATCCRTFACREMRIGAPFRRGNPLGAQRARRLPARGEAKESQGNERSMSCLAAFVARMARRLGRRIPEGMQPTKQRIGVEAESLFLRDDGAFEASRVAHGARRPWPAPPAVTSLRVPVGARGRSKSPSSGAD